MVVSTCKDEGSLIWLNQCGCLMLLKQGYREGAESLSVCLGFHRLHNRIPYNIYLEPQTPTHLLELSVKVSS